MQIDEIKVRKIMREKGFSQKELADELKIHPSTISDWINGKVVPSTKNIEALAKLFATTPEEITKETSPSSFGNFQPSFDFSHTTININLPNKSSESKSEDREINNCISMELDPEIIEKLKEKGQENITELIKDILKKHLEL